MVYHLNQLRQLLAVVLSCIAVPAIAEEVVIQDKNGCKTYNSAPQPTESITWSGACKNGFIDGPGILQWFEGDTLSSVHEGTFLEGRVTGYAKANYLTKKFAYEGDTLNGKAHGYGEIRHVGEGWRYSGEFWEDKFQGLGEVTRDSGSRTQGQWKEGAMTGFMVESYTNGRIAQGMVTDGKFNGPGSLTFESGDRVDTTWLAGELQLDAPCREYSRSGEINVEGTIKLNKKGLRICTKSRGAKFGEFLVGVSQALNTYASSNGYSAVADPNNPYAFLNQIAQIQASKRQERKQQQQQMLQVQMMQQAAAQQVAAQQAIAQASNQATSNEVAMLRAQLAERDRQLAAAQQPSAPANRSQPPPQQQTRPNPPPPSAPRASYLHSAQYDPDGKGGIIFNVYIENTGEAVLSCSTRVTGLVWSGSSIGNDLQDNYSDRRSSTVYPGRKQVVAGFSRAVANTGNYETSCNRQ